MSSSPTRTFGGAGNLKTLDHQQVQSLTEKFQDGKWPTHATAHVEGCSKRGCRRAACRVPTKYYDVIYGRLIYTGKGTKLIVAPVGDVGNEMLTDGIERVVKEKSLQDAEFSKAFDEVLKEIDREFWFWDDKDRIDGLLGEYRARSSVARTTPVGHEPVGDLVSIVRTGFQNTNSAFQNTNSAIQNTNIALQNTNKNCDKLGESLGGLIKIAYKNTEDIAGLAARADGQDGRISGLSARVDEQEGQMVDFSRRADGQETQIADFSRRLTLVEKRVTPKKRTREAVSSSNNKKKYRKKTGPLRVYIKSSEVINDELRRGAMSEKTEKLVESIKAELAGLPAFEGTVYRGVNLDKDFIELLKRSGKYVEHAFLSTSKVPIDQQTHNRFILKTCRMTIHSKAGRDISWFAPDGYKDEEEVLFAPSTHFAILSWSYDETEKRHHFVLEEM